ncbi:cytochrome c [Myxococcota bacterium]|nr:cytochrome c [Myxococcota bacterium]
MLSVVRSRLRPLRHAGRGWRAAALVGAVSFVGCTSRAEPASPDASTPPDGERIFSMACLRCHGPDGRGDGPLALKLGPVPDLNGADLAHRYDRRTLGELLRYGRGNMPPHRDRLSPGELDAVQAFVMRRFGGAP